MSHGIQHITTAPYHPRSNGEAKRLVQTFKNYMDKADPHNVTELQECVINFLAGYRATPHTVTNQTPSELLNNRMRTRLNLVHSCQPITNKAVLCQEQNYDVNTRAKQFLIGDPVWIRNFRPGKCWLAGTITKRKGNVMYKVTLEGKAVVWNRHGNQLHIRSAVTLPMPSTSDSSNNNPIPATESQNSQESAPPVLHRSLRIRKPRIPWSPST